MYIRFRRAMPKAMRGPVLALAVWLIFTSVAAADIIGLKTGQQLEGTIALRATMKERLAEQDELAIWIIDAGTGQFIRVPIEEIDFVVFEDGESRDVRDVASMHLGSAVEPQPEPQPVPRVFREPSDPPSGVGFIAAGAAVASLGAFVKFGGPKATVTEGSVDVDEDSYNAANYLLMVGGGVLMAVGIAMQVKDSGSGGQHSSISLDPCLSPVSGDAALALRVLF